MATETERRFLVDPDDPGLRDAIGDTAPIRIRQGYICEDPSRVVRVRRSDRPDGTTVCRLTVKGRRAGGACPEFEYDVPAEDFEAMFAMCAARLDKRRHVLHPSGWEIDVFDDPVLRGLAIAEIELDATGTPPDLPDWLGREITDDPDHANAALARKASDAAP